MDEKLLADAAAGLGIDGGKGEQVKDLAAVAMTRLAWREGPVEDWHWFGYRRIDDAEMMRANAATTRAVREAMDLAPEPGAIFRRVGQVLADPSRRLPDGRTTMDLAPGPREWNEYRAHAAAYRVQWESVAAYFGVDTVLTLLACHGARFTWYWWLSTGWPRLVGEFVRRLDEPERWNNASEVANWHRPGGPPGGVATEELRLALLAGPDRLDPTVARFCLRAGLSALRSPRDYGLPPVWRWPLPPAYFGLVDIRSWLPSGPP